MKDTIELAREAGIDWHKHWNDDESNRLEHFASLVRADERAKLQPKKIKAVQKDDYCHGDERYYANE
jgi:hypothetical protein